MYPFNVGEVVDRQIGIGDHACESTSDPFQGATAVVVRVAKDTMVPMAEVGLLLVEDM